MYIANFYRLLDRSTYKPWQKEWKSWRIQIFVRKSDYAPNERMHDISERKHRPLFDSFSNRRIEPGLRVSAAPYRYSHNHPRPYNSPFHLHDWTWAQHQNKTTTNSTSITLTFLLHLLSQRPFISIVTNVVSQFTSKWNGLPLSPW